ncbi:MAG: hypothetical protein U0228_38080 [Myxococcaceae bacterium]
MRTSLLLAALLVSACAAPIPAAPDAIDSNLEWFWVHAVDGSDAELATGAAQLSVAGKADSRTSPLKARGRVNLTSDDLKPVGMGSVDPSTAHPIVMVDFFACTMDKLAAILSDPDQNAEYPGVWDKHDRTMHGDRDQFLAKSQPTISWDADMGATFPVGDPYTSKFKGSLRWVKPPKSEVPTDFLVARLWLTEPATFTQPDSKSWLKHDYEVEIFWEQAPNKIFHAYGMWRDVNIGGFGYTLDNNDFFTIVSNNLVDWDKKTEALCAK